MAKVVTPYIQKLKSDMILKSGMRESTAAGYINNLVLLNSKKGFTNLGFTKKYDEVEEYLGQYDSDRTKANYTSAILAALLLYKETHLYKAAYKHWKQRNAELLGEIKKVDPTELTPKEESNWIDWENVINIYNEMKGRVEKYKKLKKLPGNPFEQEEAYNEILKFLILSLYVLIPSRRNLDYLCMYVLRDDKRDNMIGVYNYLFVDDEEFVFQNYKTSKKHGVQKEHIPEELMDTIKLYLKFHPALTSGAHKKPVQFKFLAKFGDNEGKTFDPKSGVNAITRILNSVFGKNISSSMLRHSFLTHSIGGEVQKLEALAQAMGHTVETQRKYIKTAKIPENMDIISPSGPDPALQE
jgi:hypothetical protein